MTRVTVILFACAFLSGPATAATAMDKYLRSADAVIVATVARAIVELGRCSRIERYWFTHGRTLHGTITAGRPLVLVHFLRTRQDAKGKRDFSCRRITPRSRPPHVKLLKPGRQVILTVQDDPTENRYMVTSSYELWAEQKVRQRLKHLSR